MKPILFDKNATQFNTNGLGTLEFISCIVTEERNGQYELEAEIAESVLHASEIAMDSIILAKPSDKDTLQPFRVYKIEKSISGRYTISAQHISYQLNYIPTMPFSVSISQNACNQALQGLKTNAAQTCPFNFETDVTTLSSFAVESPIAIKSALGGTRGSILDRFGGEFEWDKYTVKLWKNRGRAVPTVSLRYGKNITDLTQEEYITNTITGVVPFWKDTDGLVTVTLTEKVVESQYASAYPFKRTVPLDLSQSFENQPTEAQLRATAQAYVNQNGLGIPKVSIKVSFVALWQTEEYKDIAALEKVNLCDMVKVVFEDLGISTTAKVVKTVYDVLTERYNSIEIGTIRTSLADTITDTNGALETTLSKALWATKNATAWLTGSNGYVMAVKNPDGSWKELLFLDTNDASTAHNVLRVNENGIGFSSTGVAGPYTQAWTLDGKLVIGGTNVPSLTVYDNSTPPVKVFEVTKDGLIWNTTQSSMDINGNIIARNLSITSTNFKLDSSGNMEANSAKLTSATITGKFETISQSTSFEADADGVAWQDANSSKTKAGVITAKNANLENVTIKGGSLAIVQVVNDNEVEIFKVSSDGKLKVQTPLGVTVFEVDQNGVYWNESGVENGVNVASSMSKNGFLTAQGARLSNCHITGGDLYQEDNNRYLQLVNGNIHGGYVGSQNTVYLAYTVSGTHCIALGADGVAFDSNVIFVRDSRGGQYYRGANGSYVKDVTINGINVSTETITDMYGVDHTVVTGVSGGDGSWNTGTVVNGICT